ncbi:MAG: cupin domain-containing protein [Gemmatimonadetes bacterium]|nr:cupin domain-containing protein [Gemmatimonadota bacterium]
MTTPSHPRAAALIQQLRLDPHPEGGHFRELFRSRRMVRTDDGRSERWAVTTIYYLLVAGEYSRWHRVAADEIWHFYEGDPVELTLLDSDGVRVKRDVLGPVGSETVPVRCVPAGCWQAARPLGAYTLVGCTVAPGFEFSDFRLLQDDARASQALRERHPELATLL